MTRKLAGALSSTVLFTLLAAATAFAGTRHWETGKLLSVERQTVQTGSMQTSNTDGTVKHRSGNKADYNENTTTHTVNDEDHYEVYTIQGAEKTYVAREKLNFPWSKPAKVDVGDTVKFAVEGGKLYILDSTEKEHKASISKASLNAKE